ncbi:pilus assembly protein PilX [Salmonella enterica subsp. enterica serovar Albany]|uniref:Pilus assembly protein PilX n=1 Tax=Salmonella enterica subsp. enterica serovar Albany TaxID=211968 RepID=A0A607YAX0_SALET|nr:pilus assembly protein PilX [Salmonella enterica subsp. enterica serovar Albany]ECQ4393851.1 pilus assembly protein PilX [Salmonella enterica subsp. enterica]EDB7263931.1 pilus assembly protein PilX [Salmonella enterica]EBB5732022.1 pilus assembly protein PilX [Salmonella enterica subsp. enterica serovar Albany]EBF4171293.1 pilus assembly protein PilX [Salmonella enterica subsp. enterica serovar Albany]
MNEFAGSVMGRTPDRGMSADAGATAIFILVIVGLIAAGVWSMWGKKDAGSELTNYQNLATNTTGMMKGVDGYAFSSGAKMTGAIIQAGGAKGMTIKGTASSGTATLWNAWGGQIVVAPDTAGGSGFNNGFTITTNKVPQSACVSITTGMSRSGGVSGIKINGSSHTDAKVTAETASSECTADTGTTGTNTLVFSFNG